MKNEKPVLRGVGLGAIGRSISGRDTLEAIWIKFQPILDDHGWPRIMDAYRVFGPPPVAQYEPQRPHEAPLTPKGKVRA